MDIAKRIRLAIIILCFESDLKVVINSKKNTITKVNCHLVNTENISDITKYLILLFFKK
jgi:hypothetical protein